MRNSILAMLVAGAAATGIMATSGASASTCLSLPTGGGIPSAGCTASAGDSFINLTDASSNPSILWSGTSHVIEPGGNDSEINVEATLDHVFDTYVDLGSSTKLDGSFSVGDFTITNNNGGFGTFTHFDWNYTGSETLAVLTLKISNEFLVMDISGQTSGFVENTLITAGGGPSGPNPQGISHVTFWAGEPNQSVSEPAVLGLALVGMGSIMWMRRRKG